MAAPIARAYVQIAPITKGLKQELEKAVGGDFDSTGKKGGKGFAGGFAGAAKAGIAGAALAVGATAAAGLGTALTKGFGRLTAIDNAEAKLRGLGHSAETITQIMDDSLKSVQGTAFGLEEAAGVSAQMVAAGIQPGAQLEGTLKTIADTATIAGTSMTDMGVIFGQVANAGKLQGDELNQLAERGVPALQMLSEHLGKSTTEVRDMVSAGEVDFQTFAAAIDAGMGGAALKSGETFQGALANVGAAMGRIGATLLEPFFGLAKDGMNGLTGILDNVNAALKPLMENVGQWLEGIDWGAFFSQFEGIGGIFSQIWEAVQPLVPAFIQLWTNLSPLSLAFETLKPSLPTLVDAFTTLAQIIGQVLVQALEFLLPIIGELVEVLGQKLFAWFQSIAPIVAQVGELLGAVLVVALQTLMPIVSAVISVVMALVQALMPVVQIVLNLISALLPPLMGLFQALTPVIVFVGQVVGVLAQVVGAILVGAINLLMPILRVLITVFQVVLVAAINIATGIIRSLVWYIQNIVVPVFSFLWQTVSNVFTWISSAVTSAWQQVLRPIFDLLVAIVRQTLGPAFTWLYDNVIRPVWDAISSKLSDVWQWIKGNVFDPLMKIVKDTIPDAFDKAVEFIGKAWDALKKAARTPVAFVVETIIRDGLVKPFNNVAEFFKVDGIDEKPFTVPALATGGSVPGYSPTDTADNVPIWATAGEFMVQRPSVRALERAHPGFLDYINRHGRLPGYYANGGLIELGKTLEKYGVRVAGHTAFPPVGKHSTNSEHYSDNAIDLNYGPGGTNATETNFFNQLAPILHQLGWGVIWQWKGHYGHLHVGTNQSPLGNWSRTGGNLDGGLEAALAGITNGGGGEGWGLLDAVKGLLDQITGGVGDSRFGQFVASAGTSAVQSAIDWITDKLSFVTDIAGTAVSAVGDRVTKERVRAVAATYGWGWGNEWNALDWLISKESSWNPQAANPSSSARGLFQKMTSIHGPLENTIEGQSRWGLDYIDDRYGSPSAAKAFHQSNGWYAHGGKITPGPSLYDTGGILPPGLTTVLNATGGNEYVYRPDQVPALDTERALYELHFHGIEGTPDAFADRMRFELNRINRGGVYATT